MNEFKNFGWAPNNAARKALEHVWLGHKADLDSAYWYKSNMGVSEIFAFVKSDKDEWKDLGFACYRYDPATEAAEAVSCEYAKGTIIWAGQGLTFDLLRKVVTGGFGGHHDASAGEP